MSEINMDTENTVASSKQKVNMVKKGLMGDHHGDELLGGGGGGGDDGDGGGGGGGDGNVKKKKGGHSGGRSSSATRCCQAEKCTADLTEVKQYHRRHKVCELHAKAQVVIVAGTHQRFCQQCSRFHELSEFDEAKRSCRRRLAGHNERRRKSSTEFKGTGKELVCGEVDDRGRFQESYGRECHL